MNGYVAMDVFAYPGQSSKSEAMKDVTYETEDGQELYGETSHHS